LANIENKIELIAVDEDLLVYIFSFLGVDRGRSEDDDQSRGGTRSNSTQVKQARS